MNPSKVGKLDNHDQEPSTAPLPQFIEHLYFKRFGREQPDVVIGRGAGARAGREEGGAEGSEAPSLRGGEQSPPGGA